MHWEEKTLQHVARVNDILCCLTSMTIKRTTTFRGPSTQPSSDWDGLSDHLGEIVQALLPLRLRVRQEHGRHRPRMY